METFKSVLMRKIAQLPSGDFTTACVITIIFFVVGISVLLFSGVDVKVIFWLTMALICSLWYICILEII